MKNIGFWFDKIDNQSIIEYIQNEVAKEFNVVIFYNTIRQDPEKKVCFQHGIDTWGYRDTLIAMDEEAAKYLDRNPYPRKKITVQEGINEIELETILAEIRD